MKALLIILIFLTASSSKIQEPFLKQFTADLQEDISCRECTTGSCASCWDVCSEDKTGSCASCWEYDEKTNFACFSDNPNVSTCLPCFQQYPCSLCDVGSCAHCLSCQDSKAGECASCWEPNAVGTTCLHPEPDKNMLDWDCKRCWNPKAPPIIFLSGLTASTLEATWGDDIAWCSSRQSKPQQVWPFTNETFSTIQSALCYTNTMAISFNDSSSQFTAPESVTVDTVHFGQLDGLTFGDLVGGTMQIGGWREGVNMWGAPFDWRHSNAGLEQIGFYAHLKQLTEKAYNQTGQKVSLICPSYGGQTGYGFLHRMTQEWKDKHIHWFIADSPVWSGSPTAMSFLASGAGPDPFNSIRGIAWSWPSVVWLSPLPGDDKYLYGSDEPILVTPTRNYSAQDLAQLAIDIGSTQYVDMVKFLHANEDLATFEAPLVNTFVNYATGTPTPSRYIYNASFARFGAPPQPETVEMDGGDGIVAARSSERSLRWAFAHKAGGYELLHKDYDNMGHAACLSPVIDPNAAGCFNDVYTLLLYGTIPQDLTHQL